MRRWPIARSASSPGKSGPRRSPRRGRRYDAVSRLTRQDNDDLPALALSAALGLVDYFIREHDLVEESWVRTACWIGDNFDMLRLPVSALSE